MQEAFTKATSLQSPGGTDLQIKSNWWKLIKMAYPRVTNYRYPVVKVSLTGYNEFIFTFRAVLHAWRN